MGIEYVVLHEAAPPSLSTVRQLLADHGIALQTRMIDGELAFPDEEPKGPWSELRVAIQKNMITLRRDAHGIHVLTWGNADDAMQEVWRRLVWALAEVTGAPIASPMGQQSAEEFRRSLHP
ncbi:hypothetical protein K2X85_02035 [bacterium]|nr:hypothetical protein [bacterium]